MLGLKIDQEAYEKLSDDLKAEYEQDGDSYVIQVEGMKSQEDVDRVLEAKNQEKRLRKEAESKLKEVEQEKHELADKVKVYEEDGSKKLSSEERLDFERMKRELEAKTTEHAELAQKYEGLETEHTSSIIRAELRKQAEGVIRAEAIDDTVNQLVGTFTLSDVEGKKKVLTNSEQGDQSGLDARAYLSSYVKDRSYLKPVSTGGGAGGGQGAGGSSQQQEGESSMEAVVGEAWAGTPAGGGQ